jgi:cell fate regulator YaaT (PSP1 superfamily)
MVMAVSFNRHGRLYYLDPSGVEPAPRVGDRVLVPTTTAPEVAEVVWAGEWVDGVEDLPACAGHAGPGHLDRDERSRRKRAEILSASRRSIGEAGLPMKVIAVDWVEEQTSATVYFTAPHRVDFRQLVRDLNKTLACRVELRQLGPRDEARVQGSLGPCGRDTCCSTFLKDFEPVSVRMAKDQDLPLNPLKISGACGRLMCCLKYEHPLYLDFKAEAPEYGDPAYTSEGAGTVVGMNVPAGTISIRLAETGKRTSCPKAEVCGSRREYEERQAARS